MITVAQDMSRRHAILAGLGTLAATALSCRHEGNTNLDQLELPNPQGKLRQSPVDLCECTDERLANPKLSCCCTPIHVVRGRHELKVEVHERNELELPIGNFVMQQFHFHTPSEHVLNGKRFPAEVHFVFRDTSQQLAVIGVFIESGDQNLALEAILKNTPPTPGEILKGNLTINPSDLLPAKQTSLRYDGSLTTPPYSENVKWFVMEHPIHAASEQIERLHAIVGKNSRPVQPLNGREILHDMSA